MAGKKLEKRKGRTLTARLRQGLLGGLLGLLLGLMAVSVLPACSASSPEPAPSSSSQAKSNEAEDSFGAKTALPAQVVVDVDVDCSEAVTFGNELASSEAPDGKLFAGTVAINEGESALDALRATGLNIVIEELAVGPFVDSIQGLASGATGAMSGWIFSVNGESSAVGMSEVIMQSNDVLEVRFINEF